MVTERRAALLPLLLLLAACDAEEPGPPDLGPLINPWDTPSDGHDRDGDGTDGAGLAFADAWVQGDVSYEHLGRAIAGLGDLDGDGRGELLLGGQNWGCSEGRAYVVEGAALMAGGGSDVADAAYILEGEDCGDQAGRWVASAGDVDGDGRDDLLVGAPTRDEGRGAAYLVLAADLRAGRASLGSAHAVLVGDDPFDHAGDMVAGAGDVDGDGLADVIVGAWGADTPGQAAGVACLFLGRDLADPGRRTLSEGHACVRGEAAGDRLGHAVASAGDVDGDGRDDLLLGAHGADDAGADAGKAVIFFATTLQAGGTLSAADADVTLLGDAPGDFSGFALSSAGDVDGDGLADVVSGAYRNDDGGPDAGKTALYLGADLAAGGGLRRSGAHAHGTWTGANRFADVDVAGWAVAGGGDADGDGRGDVLVGAMWSDTGGFNAGESYLLLSRGAAAAGGTRSLTEADAAFVGEAIHEDEAGLRHDQSGEYLAFVGDIDGDGLDDFVIGAPDNGDGAGRAYLILSRY